MTLIARRRSRLPTLDTYIKRSASQSFISLQIPQPPVPMRQLSPTCNWLLTLNLQIFSLLAVALAEARIDSSQVSRESIGQRHS